MEFLTVRLPDDGGRSVRYVGIAGIIALMLGGTFLVCAIHVTEPATPPENAARWAALLWAFACCAVGAFLGFIFGIPRSLSSDTTRTAVPMPGRTLDAPTTKMTALKAAAQLAADERDATLQAANEVDTKLTRAAAELEQLKAAAGQEAIGDMRLQAAIEVHGKLAEERRKLDENILEKARAAERAEAQVKKDHEEVNASSNPGAATFTQLLNSRAPSTAVNTNLEQISDWLTKIIVGVSLVNSEKIGHAMVRASGQMDMSFGGDTMQSLALAMLTYFSVIGLLGGYLLTRLYLQRAFEAIGSADMVTHHRG